MVQPNSNDRRIYKEEILPWLPKKIIDCHVHIGLEDHSDPISPERIAESWALEIKSDMSWEDLQATYRELLPEQKVSILVFGHPRREVDQIQSNRYVMDKALQNKSAAHALVVTKPEWDASVIESAMFCGFAGIKPYPDFAPQNLECSIYDFLPKSHLAMLNRLGGVLMLHLPRRGRIADPENIRELTEIYNDYPNIKMVVAHIGRAYCLPTAEEGLPPFADCTRMYFDTAANLNTDVFQFALETLGPDRVLFGTDLPITLMRGVREHVGDKYINFTDGDYSWNKNRKSAEEESEYTYYLYEELLAIIRAVKSAGMGHEEMEKIVYRNCARILGES